MRTPDKPIRPTPQIVNASFLEAASASGARALPETVRETLEPRFQHSFANVRVYDNAQAASANSALGAKAFTVGEDIFFGGGRFQPETPVGMRLLSHELAHTVQQGPLSGVPNTLNVSRPGDAHETAARDAGWSAARGGTVGALGSSGPAVQCELENEEVQASMPEPLVSQMPLEAAPIMSVDPNASLPVEEPPSNLNSQTLYHSRTAHLDQNGNETGVVTEFGLGKDGNEKKGMNIGALNAENKVGAWTEADGSQGKGADFYAGTMKLDQAPRKQLGNWGFDVQGPNATAGASVIGDKSHIGGQYTIAGAAATYDNGDTLIRGGLSAGAGLDFRTYEGERGGFGFDVGPLSFDYRDRGGTAPGQINDGAFPVSGGPGFRADEPMPEVIPEAPEQTNDGYFPVGGAPSYRDESNQP